LKEWETCWKALPEALSNPHRELRKKVGLLRFSLDGVIKYFVQATEVKHGLPKGLRRLSGPEQTGNKSHGAQMVRKHKHDLKVDVLIVGEGEHAAKNTKNLKKALNRLHDPEWSWPAKRRMAKIRSGEIPSK
jgi:hypothetical protein